MKKMYYLIMIIFIFILIAIIIYNNTFSYINNNYSDNRIIIDEKQEPIVISFVGDCVLGNDSNFYYSGSLIKKYETVKDFGYFFSGVYDVLNNDSLTIANLESVFTDTANVKMVKKFNFKAPSKFVKILTAGSVELVNIANNHSHDYLNAGFNDTQDILDNEGIFYVGYDKVQILTINGKKIGVAGIPGWDYSTAKGYIDKALTKFKNCDYKIFNFHWGIEKDYKFNETQQKIAHYVIDHGGDLVIGHHPHVIQGIEQYHNKYIVYSLANFVFGGNYHPYDFDSFIFQINLNFQNELQESVDLIPVSISSTKKQNDFKPILLEGKEKKRVIDKILKYSHNFQYDSQ